MKSMNCALGALLVIMLFATSFAAGATGTALKESQVTIQQSESDPFMLNLGVLAFDSATSTRGTTAGELAKQFETQCADECATHTLDCASQSANINTCMQQKSAKATAGTDYRFTFESVQNANISVLYYNQGTWQKIPECQGLQATTPLTTYINMGGTPEEHTYYYTTCNVSSYMTGVTVREFRAVFPGTDTVSESFAPITLRNANVTTETGFAGAIRDAINSLAGGNSTVPCMGVFLIMGLLLASLYFAGKSPISLLDITTPRLPAPKGVTAGGQILTPFGYTEMKRTTKDKMTKAVAGVGASLLAAGASKTVAAKTSREQDLLGLGASDRTIAAGLEYLGKKGGISTSALSGKLPFHYGEAEHKTVAEILKAAEARGGRDALMAMTVKDYLLSQRTFKSLEVITGQEKMDQFGNLKVGGIHTRVSNIAGKFYGPNRYAVLGGAIMPAIGSVSRSIHITKRMGTAAVKEAAPAARAIGRTTMEMLGGRHAMQELEARARVSPTAAWVSGQLNKHPSDVKIGNMFPVNDKMGHLYKTLHNEVLADQMRYVLRQIYKKNGVHFNVSEEELAQMGHTDVDILKRCGYTGSAGIAAAESEIRAILAATTKNPHQKLEELVALAERQGAHLDGSMRTFAATVSGIEHSAQPEHLKMLTLQQALEEQNHVRMAVTKGGMVAEDKYLCHVGGDSLKGTHVFETMVLRTMVWDGMNGYLNGGIKEELLSARLNVANRLATLDPSANHGLLPEYMRNDAQLKAVSERNRKDLVSLFTEEGRKQYSEWAAANPKDKQGRPVPSSIEAASISQLVGFMKQGAVPGTGKTDPKTGRLIWFAEDTEHGLAQNAALVDLKRHWLDQPTSQGQGLTLGGWVEGRFTKSYVTALNQSIEAELNRMPGSASWSVEQRAQQAKKLFVADQLRQDMEQRFNSQFGQNTYGTTHETMKFYSGVAAGFLEAALQKKGLANNHPDMQFLQQLDSNNPKHVEGLRTIMQKYSKEYAALLDRPMTYEDITRSNKAVVMMHEGGFAFYKKGMLLSDADRIMAGETALRDNKGQLRKFIPDDVPVKFTGRDDLMAQYNKTRSSQDPAEWQGFVQSTTKWAKEGGYDYEKQKVLAAVLWQYANATHDYSSFWNQSGVSVEAKRQVTPVAPSVLRYFGYEGSRAAEVLKPFRDIGLAAGDYVTKVALAAGGSVHKTSYDITPTSSILRQHSDQLAFKIMSDKKMMAGLSEAERVAYNNVAISHGAYLQVWQFAIDRNPWRTSSSYGGHQAWESMFHMGPAVPFSVKTNLKAYMNKGEYTNFMAFHGFPMDFAGKLLRPYVSMMRGMQMSMTGYASSWDQVPDAMRQWNYTSPRLMEAMQSLNPFSSKWMPGKGGERIAKLNVFGGSLEQHQLAGDDFMSGLKQGPSHTFMKRKGVYAFARTGDVNPGETYYDYRMTMRAEAPMAEYLFREKEATYLYDDKIRQAAMDNTTRRTVSAESLAIRRDQELRGFGILQNSLFGWANPVAFLWHMPLPGVPQSATPKDMVAKYVARHKFGQGGTFGDSMRRVGESISQGATRLTQPQNTHRVVWCPRCSTSGYRGSTCKNCRQALY